MSAQLKTKLVGLSAVTKAGLTEEQFAALQAMLTFWESNQQEFLLSGRPGTGKTSRVIPAFLEASGAIPLFTAPTNEATRALEKNLPPSANCMTTFSALGLSLTTSSYKKKLTQRDLPESLFNHDVLIVDEASMVSSAEGVEAKLLLQYLRDLGMRIIYTGDWAQLPPVESEKGTSPIWELDLPGVELKQVMRNKGQILEYVERIRSSIGQANPVFPSFADLPEITHYQEPINLTRIPKIVEQFRSGELTLLCWTNQSTKFCRSPGVNNYNAVLREHFFGSIAAKESILPGDKVIFTSLAKLHKGTLEAHLSLKMPVVQGNKLDLKKKHTINTRAEVMRVTKRIFLDIPVYETQMQVEGGQDFTALIVSPEGQRLFEEVKKAMRETAIASGDRLLAAKAWQAYHGFCECFLEIKHTYAMTTHRAQGSTLPSVIVSARNIWQNKDILVRFKSYNVACSRAQNNLSIIW